MTRHEIEYYKNIERIATALEKLVAQSKDIKLDRFKHAANLMYGNDATIKPSKGRSDDNYTYPQFVDRHYKKKVFLTTARYDDQRDSIMDPSERNDLEQRMYDESQKLTGGEFQDWFDKLNKEERNAYTRVYNF